MIKELFYCVCELAKDLFTFKWKYLTYDIQNLYCQEFEDLKFETQEHLQNRFQNLFKKYFFHLWF